MTDPEELAVFKFTSELLHYRGKVSDEAFEGIRSRWGHRGVLDLTGAIMQYSVVSTVLNMDKMGIPCEYDFRLRGQGVELTIDVVSCTYSHRRTSPSRSSASCPGQALKPKQKKLLNRILFRRIFGHSCFGK